MFLEPNNTSHFRPRAASSISSTMSDEVSSFLRSVEQLNHRRDEDEEARSKELEEKILQQRRERQARRQGTSKYNVQYSYSTTNR